MGRPAHRLMPTTVCNLYLYLGGEPNPPEALPGPAGAAYAAVSGGW
jgi:hypothetical protein